MTEPAVAWAEAFVAAQFELPAISKDKTARVGSYSYTYASLQAIVDKVRPILHKHGFAFAQDVQDRAFHNAATIAVYTRIIHVAGHIETFGPVVLSAGSTPQEAGSATTYARRYGLTAALGLVTDEDDDAQRVSPRPRQTRQTRRSASDSGPPAGSAGEESTAEPPAYGEGVSASESGSSSAPKQLPGHKPGCNFPGVSEFRADENTAMPKGRLRCTGCGASLKEAELS